MSRNYLTGTEIANLKDQIKIDIRSLLCSSKDGLTEPELKREYYNLNGHHIPYVELGFNSLYDLLRNYDFIDIRRHRNGMSWVFYAIPDENSRELARLIAGQKDPNKNIREKKRFNEGNRYRFRQNYRRQDEHPQQGLVSSDAQNNIEEILKKAPQFSLYIDELGFEFKKRTGFDLNPKKFGFQSMLSMFESIDHLVSIEKSTSNDNFVVSLKFMNNKEIKMTFDEQIVENLKLLIEKFDKEGISLKNLSKAYFDTYSKQLDFERLGYANLLEFLSNKLGDFIELVESENNNEFIVMKRQIKNSDDKSDSSQNCDIVLFKKIVKCVENALKNHVDERISEKKFHSLFEKANGFKISEIDSKKFEQVAAKMYEKGIMKIEYDEHFDVIYTLPSEYVNKKVFASDSSTSIHTNSVIDTIKNDPKNYLNSLSKNGPLSAEDFEKAMTVSLSKKERELYEWRKYQAEFIQEYVIYDDSIPKTELHKLILTKREHKIIVSNVINPCNFQIQLTENITSLEELMDSLEKVYYGVGSGYYDMPEEYVNMGKLCVAIFELDKNWHRCRITGLDFEKKLAIVEFIDYGGESTVPMNSLKFLLKQFTYLPAQAIDACFFNIRSRPENLWRKDVINYLINRMINKVLDAKIMGIRNGFVSIDLFEKTSSECNGRPSGTLIHLNKRVVMDGYADMYDEESDNAFSSFNEWKEQYELDELEQMFSKKSLSKSASDLSTSKMSNSNQKDLNNSNNNSNQKCSKSKIEYKFIDEMNENSVLKEKRLKVSCEDLDFFIYLLWLDKKQLIHYSQVLEILELNDILFDNFLRHPKYLAQKEVLVTKFFNIPNNKLIFEWVQNTLGLNLDEENETYFIVYENLGKFLKFMCTPSKYKKIIEAFDSKSSKNQSPQYYTKSELNHSIKCCEKAIERLKQRRQTFDQDSIQFKQTNEIIKKYSSLRETYSHIYDSLY